MCSYIDSSIESFSCILQPNVGNERPMTQRSPVVAQSLNSADLLSSGDPSLSGGAPALPAVLADSCWSRPGPVRPPCAGAAENHRLPIKTAGVAPCQGWGRSASAAAAAAASLPSIGARPRPHDWKRTINSGSWTATCPAGRRLPHWSQERVPPVRPPAVVGGDPRRLPVRPAVIPDTEWDDWHGVRL